MDWSVTGLLNELIIGVGNSLSWILNLLPSSPFIYVPEWDAEWLKAINWIFPVSGAIAHLEAFVTAVIGYYTIRIILKWMKAAGA